MPQYIPDLNSAALALDRAKNVVTVSHRRPDGDTLGSAFALATALRARGKTVSCFCVDAPPASLESLISVSDFTTNLGVLAAADLVVVLDAGDLRFAGIGPALAALPKRPVLIDVDHHVVNERFGDINLIIAGAASTTEVVFRLLKTLEWHITPAMATALLLGIVTDTMMFFNPATTASSLQVAAELERLGGDIKRVAKTVSKSRSIGSLVLWGRALERLKWDEERSRASTAIMADEISGLCSGDDAVDGLSNFLNNNLAARTVLVLRELGDGMVKGSLRTACEDHDVSLEAVAMGGGGHKKAAGYVAKGKIVEGEKEWMVKVD